MSDSVIKVLPLHKIFDSYYLKEWYFDKCSPNENGKWQDVQIVNSEPCDYYLILTQPNLKNMPLEFNANKAIVVYQEPSYYRKYCYAWYIRNYVNRKMFYAWFDKFMFPLWWTAHSYSWHLKNTEFLIASKTKKISAIFRKKTNQMIREFVGAYTKNPEALSRAVTMDGYNERLGIVENLDYIDFIEGFSNPIKLKEDMLINYKFHLAFENCREQGYWTEKIIDPIMFLSVPFYRGAPDIGKYIDERSFINLTDKNSYYNRILIDEICQGNYEDVYRDKLPFMIDARNKLLNQYNPLEILRKIIYREI